MLARNSRTRAVIFDMDGVLLLSTDCHAEAYARALGDSGVRKFAYAEVAGMRTDEAIRMLFAREGKELGEERLQELVRRKRECALALLSERSRIAPGCAGLLADLRRKYRLALASSASRNTVRLFLEQGGFKHAFETVIDGTEVAKAKPDPEIYSLALARLGLAPEEAVVIEDAESGVEAAARAGIPVIGVAGTGGREALLRKGAAVAVDGLEDVADILLP